MSPNMMLACTRPLQFQQGPFFIPLTLTLSPLGRGDCTVRSLSPSPLWGEGRGEGKTTAWLQSTPRASGPGSLQWFCRGRPDRGTAPAIR
ncbi:hypothetical protein DBY73_017945 [Enterobacter sp. RIT418]|nr:hypothetical protein DBY73_017945 [Enterobacter sp. RIT 418]